MLSRISRKRRGSHYAGLLSLLILLALACASTSLFHASAQSGASSKQVVLVQLNVQIDQGSSSLMSRAISRAESGGASAVIIEMNTPGGLLQDMLLMVDSISNSTVPVYTYVPNDSIAASAGSYIAMATDKIFMGPGSQIGPSTPIVVGGTPLEENHTADAMLTLMASLASEHGRNRTAAAQMVAYDIAYSYSDALKYHIADESSNSLAETLRDLNLSSASVVAMSESVTEQLVSFLSNSIVDGILLLVGIIAIVLDFLHPTIILSIAGAVLIALGIIGAEAITSGAGSAAVAVPLILFALAATLIIFELKTRHGFMMLAGVIVGAIATLLLAYQVPYSPSPIGDLQLIELAFLILIGGLLALYARWIGGSIRRKPLTGAESLIGKTATVTSDLNPKGEVSVDGIIWEAVLQPGSTQASASKGERVVIKSLSGLTLIVQPESIKQKATV